MLYVPSIHDSKPNLQRSRRDVTTLGSLHRISLIHSYLSHTGVPQGSPLAPALLKLFMADLPLPKQSNTVFYADDIAFFTTRYSPDVIRNRFQAQLNQAVVSSGDCRLTRVKLRLFCSIVGRSSVYIASKKKKDPIPWLQKVSYLSLQFDRRFQWSVQTQHAICKGIGVYNILYPLLCRKSKSPDEWWFAFLEHRCGISTSPTDNLHYSKCSNPPISNQAFRS
ncbi:uncharacterized protein LOC143190857 [Rhynchophorus ferrugineus]|uniref:uncharacterized protein LOC143190857 n=1 Tax=Rhynchophorus ferrugineus TaxID=354439 RepID=UPI003FCD465A